ncbi:MAG: ORC1-type DNA replication protein [Candidatus Bathyarchaeota archaeon]|nr:MAG: ORC1-type DNA replication protein [Candidatus Bathyarchaeota archaeon]
MKDADTLDVIFENFLCNTPIFKDRNVLRHDYVPGKLPHRETQIKFLGMIVAPILRKERCSNIFIYGKPGTGKTAVMKYVLKKLAEKADELGAAVQVGYVNCRLAGTQYRVLTNLCEILRTKIPFTGLALGEVFDRFKNVLDKQAVLFVVVLDEIDEFVKNRGDDLLYELTRINESLKNSKISLVGISNNHGFKNLLDPRVLSCLGEEEVVFRPYNASELQDILWERAALAFQDSVLSESAVSLCAALAAAEHGDARRALDLLRVAGEVAERDGFQTITERHVRIAEERIEHDKTLQTLTNLTKHSKFVLYSVYLLGKANVHSAITGDIYEVYSELCNEIGSPSLTQRRVSGLINELDTIGLLNARLVSRGRYGRTKKISLAIPRTPVRETYSKDDYLSMLQNFTPTCLQTHGLKKS